MTEEPLTYGKRIELINKIATSITPYRRLLLTASSYVTGM